jgi:DinB superfamily
MYGGVRYLLELWYDATAYDALSILKTPIRHMGRRCSVPLLQAGLIFGSQTLTSYLGGRMTVSETLAQYYGLTYRVIKRQLDGVTHEESLVQPPFRGNCLNWVLGHIIVSRAEALGILEEAPPWSEADAARYRRNSDPITDGEQALPLSQLLTLLEDSQNRILAGLARATPELLEAKLDEDSRAEHITFSIWHETYHVGQLELLRQVSGKNDKVI